MKLFVIAALVVFKVLSASAQTARYITDCSHGATWISSGTLNPNGQVLMVGDLGRVGTYNKESKTIAWDCLPTQSFLYDVWSRNDTTIVVGEHGAVFYKVTDGNWKAVPLASQETIRTVTVHKQSMFIGTEEGAVWRNDSFSNDGWYLSYQASAAVIGLESVDQSLLGVGRAGGVYRLTDDWEDLSLKGSRYEFTSIASIGEFYIIGSDFGKIIRMNTKSGDWSSVQIMDSTGISNIGDFRGRSDKTLCISSGAMNSLLATGFYSPFRTTPGVRVSLDTGRTWVSTPFYADDTPLVEQINNDWCPLVATDGNSIVALSCNPVEPTTLFRSTNSGKSWSAELTSQDIYKRLDTANSFEYGKSFPIVYDGVIRSNDSYLTVQHDQVTNMEFRNALERKSVIVQIDVAVDSVKHDTLSTLDGFFECLDFIDGILYAGGDSARVATSSDYGQTWTYSKINSIAGPFAQVGPFTKHRGTLLARAIWSKAIPTSWYLSGIVELRDSGWFPAAVIPTSKVRLSGTSTTIHNGELFVLVSEVDSSDQNVGYAIYKFDPETHAFYRIIPIPRTHSQVYSAFSINDTLHILVGQENGTRRCTFIQGEWVCVNARLVRAGDTVQLTSGGLIVFNSGSMLIGSSSAGNIYSADGILWRHTPSRMRVLPSNLFFAETSGSKVFAGGPYGFATEYIFDTTQTFVEQAHFASLPVCGESVFNRGSECFLVYDMLGRLIKIDSYNDEESLRIDPALCERRMYIAAPIGKPECSIWFMR